MDSLRAFIISISVSSVMLGLILLFSPSGKTEKLVKLAAALFLLVTAFTPLLKGGLPSGLDELESALRRFDAESYNGLGDGDVSAANALSEAVKEEAARVITANGLNAFVADAVIIYKDGEYLFNGMTLKGPDADRAREILAGALGVRRDEIKTEG